jgi:hypothetical protein
VTTATPHRDSPYFGLNYYKERDGAWFFGRDNDTDRVVTNLLASRLTLLHADTGVGKSSLLRAGVARRLRVAAHKAQERGAPVYLPVVFNSWTDNPVNKLIGEITAAAGELGIDGRREGVKHLADAVDAIVGDSNLTLLLILDQFEEYFLYAATEQPEPGHFADELARCVNRSSVPASFLISIREEAYAGLGDLLKGRIANVYGNYLQIDHLDRASAEKAIREPLNVFNAQGNGQITIEDALVDAVLEQARTPLDGAITGDGRGGVGERRDERFRVATPLMELVLETVWEKERAEGSSRLRLKTLKELERGGLTIVDTYVKEALDDLDPRQRPTSAGCCATSTATTRRATCPCCIGNAAMSATSAWPRTPRRRPPWPARRRSAPAARTSGPARRSSGWPSGAGMSSRPAGSCKPSGARASWPGSSTRRSRISATRRHNNATAPCAPRCRRCWTA